ncbi:DUF2920 family protein [Campylobacter taeniopygiae]|uniref:DUF2920 domain-containing protein n=1 Tax=Campylobacter taeniopygiae TaxID=2510188 RepID=A0ABY2TIT8_9BACT|nr:DUF2920 family protein [Campylobacter taeniopygiae]TKX34034.1 hypothetical protein CQA75_03815 [Campylobacter taeniopygiae]
MLINKIYEIDSCDDVELNIKRESKLEFKLWYDDKKNPEALVFYTQGVGSDCRDKMLNIVAENLIQKFNIAFASVNYHCIGNRPQTGAIFYLDEIDKLILDTTTQAVGIKLPYSVDRIQNYDQINEILNFINRYLSVKKTEGFLSSDFYLHLHMSLQPTKNEYQNFGIMQAQDLVNVALYLKKNAPFDTMGGGIPIIMIGTSRGGYLSHLAAKIAPWFIDGVIDNSGGAKFSWRMVGFGKEIDFVQYSEFPNFTFPHINLHCSNKTFWTSNSSSPYFFSPARRMIRNILEPSHLEICAKFPNTHYVSYHAIRDDLDPLEEKIALYDYFEKLGFDAKLNSITNESQIDGKFIKNLNHGMGIPVKLLIEKELPVILAKIRKHPKKEYKEKSISYPCEDLLYKFTQKEDKILLEIEGIK